MALTDKRPTVSSPQKTSYWDSPVTSYYLILGSTVLLLGIGLVMVLSSSSVTELAKSGNPYQVFLSQLQFVLLGLPLMLVVMRLPVKFFRNIAWAALGVAFVLQLLVFTPLGYANKGNRNWIFLGSMSFQPSELLKLALAVWCAAVLANKWRKLHELKHMLIPLLPVAVMGLGLILLGHDLGTALVVALVVVATLFVAGLPWRYIFLGLGAAALAVFQLMNGNRMGRINAWLGSCDGADAFGACFQTKHGTWGLASGGFTGLGLGASRQKWSYLPEAHNDFIFAIIGEELGLVGTLSVLGLFGVLAYAMTRVISRHPDPFVKIATAGIMAWIVGQALINIGVVIGALPVIGVPLPLVSAGGSALVSTMLALGVVMAFARNEPGTKEALAARRGVISRTVGVLGRAKAGAK